jgi:hypothetical protein
MTDDAKSAVRAGKLRQNVRAPIGTRVVDQEDFVARSRAPEDMAELIDQGLEIRLLVE